jgi:hypothetical protein
MLEELLADTQTMIDMSNKCLMPAPPKVVKTLQTLPQNVKAAWQIFMWQIEELFERRKGMINGTRP